MITMTRTSIMYRRIWAPTITTSSQLQCILTDSRWLSTTTFNATNANSDKTSISDTTSTSDTTSPRPLAKPEFYVPRNQRDKRSLYDMDSMILAGEMRLARNSRLCPTRELYFLPAQWGRHKSPYRRFRHMTHLFQSAPFQRLLFPDLFCVSAVATCLVYYNEMIAPTMEAALAISPTTFAGATTAIGLLAGFRLNASYGRYREGRQVWSDTQGTLRDFARQIVMWVHNDTAKTRLLRLCEAFPIALLFHLSDKGCHHSMRRLSRLGDDQFYKRVQAEFEAELHDVYTCMRSQQKDDNGVTVVDIDNDVLRADFERICEVKAEKGSVPLEILTCMGETVAALSNCQEPLPYHFSRELDEKIQRLCKVLGAGEKLLKTPMPTGFTRHSSRLLFMWSNCLPFALYPLLGPLGTLPTSLMTSFAVLGIEDISIQLEEPFDILPMRQFSNTMYDSIQAIEKGYTPFFIDGNSPSKPQPNNNE